MRVVEATEHRGAGSRDQPIPLHLNSKVSVPFSDDVDKLTVTEDTVRMVKITPEGPQRVTMAGITIGTRTVTLDPELPLSASLDDGSYQVDQLYRLEVAGFPLTNTVHSTGGIPVEDRYVRYYRTVARDGDPGPLLPVGVPTHPFELTAPSLRMASDMRTLRLHFSLPVRPDSLSKESIVVSQIGELPIESLRLVGGRRRLSGTPGCTVEVRIAADAEVRSGALFWVDLKPANAQHAWIRDYRGRVLTQAQTVVTGWITQGSGVELLRLEGSEDLDLERMGPDQLGFTCRTQCIEVLARPASGRGTLGEFHPQQSMVLEPGQPFDRGDGKMQIGGPRFEFSGIHIPQGVTVAVRSRDDAPIEVLSTGSIQVDGELILDTLSEAVPPEPFESDQGDAYLKRVVTGGFGSRIVAAADLEVRGAIRHASLPGDRVVLLARVLRLHGPVPNRSIRAQDPGRIAGGTVQDGVPLAYAMKRGYPVGHRTTAAAWTAWHQLPEDFVGGAILARAEGIVGAVDVYLQVASPDPIDPTQPYLDPAGLLEPRKLPLKQPIVVSDRVFVRFLLRAKVIGGREPLPSVKALVVLGET